MSRMVFLNFPVRDPDKSVAFYRALGGEVNPQFSDEQTKCVMLSETIFVMLMTHERYGGFTKRPIGDARRDSYALIALSVDSRAAVDETVKRAAAAGGRADPNPLQDHGFMYNRNVEDPDGNVWEVVWMDMKAFAETAKV